MNSKRSDAVNVGRELLYIAVLCMSFACGVYRDSLRLTTGLFEELGHPVRQGANEEQTQPCGRVLFSKLFS